MKRDGFVVRRGGTVIICPSVVLTWKYSRGWDAKLWKRFDQKGLTEELAVCLRKRTILVSEAGQARAM